MLIVDDSAFMRKLLKGIFNQKGITEIFEAENGDKAIKIYKEHKPDLVTMDFVMPVMSGLECLKSILQFDKNAKVVMVSTIGQKEKIDQAINAGAKDYLIKPFDHEKISKVIENALR